MWCTWPSYYQQESPYQMLSQYQGCALGIPNSWTFCSLYISQSVVFSFSNQKWTELMRKLATQSGSLLWTGRELHPCPSTRGHPQGTEGTMGLGTETGEVYWKLTKGWNDSTALGQCLASKMLWRETGLIAKPAAQLNGKFNCENFFLVMDWSRGVLYLKNWD